MLELLLGREKVFLRTGWEGVMGLHASGPDPEAGLGSYAGQVVEGEGRIEVRVGGRGFLRAGG